LAGLLECEPLTLELLRSRLRAFASARQVDFGGNAKDRIRAHCCQEGSTYCWSWARLNAKRRAYQLGRVSFVLFFPLRLTRVSSGRKCFLQPSSRLAAAAPFPYTCRSVLLLDSSPVPVVNATT
jgi:hypothetical protein